MIRVPRVGDIDLGLRSAVGFSERISKLGLNDLPVSKILRLSYIKKKQNKNAQSPSVEPGNIN